MKKVILKAQIRIFDMDGGYTFIAAASLQDAVKCFGSEIGYKMDDEEGEKQFRLDHPDVFNEAKEFSEADLDEYTFIDDLDDRDDETEKRSFREQLKQLEKDGSEFPQLFAVSEY